MGALGIILIALLLLSGIGLVVGWRYNPFRKWVMRNLDPSWKAAAKPGTHPAGQIAAEEWDLFISSTVIRDGCDVIWDEYDPEPPESLLSPQADGAVVWVNTDHVIRFLTEFLPKMPYRFVFVTGREELSTALFDIDRALASPQLLHWFMENYEHPPSYLETGRVTPLPHGLNYHKLDPASPNQSRDMGLPAAPGAQQLDMKAIRDAIPPLAKRPLKVYANFHLNMDTFLRHPHAQKRAVARAEAREALQDKPFMVWEPRQAPRHTVWRRHAEVSFEVSPRGNSIDCHRTWEALFLGSIPIVRSTLFDPVYDGLPVAIVDDWSEITEGRLAEWKKAFLPWFEKPLPPELFSNHWIERFHSFK